jgi:hypothetical protein
VHGRLLRALVQQLDDLLFLLQRVPLRKSFSAHVHCAPTTSSTTCALPKPSAAERR